MTTSIEKGSKRYAVHVTRIAYSTKTIVVEAEDKERAMRKAEAEAGNQAFPTEHEASYEAQGATELTTRPRVPCRRA